VVLDHVNEGRRGRLTHGAHLGERTCARACVCACVCASWVGCEERESWWCGATGWDQCREYLPPPSWGLVLWLRMALAPMAYLDHSAWTLGPPINGPLPCLHHEGTDGDKCGRIEIAIYILLRMVIISEGVGVSLSLLRYGARWHTSVWIKPHCVCAEQRWPGGASVAGGCWVSFGLLAYRSLTHCSTAPLLGPWV
jgi:hypothetical protein